MLAVLAVPDAAVVLFAFSHLHVAAVVDLPADFCLAVVAAIAAERAVASAALAHWFCVV